MSVRYPASMRELRSFILPCLDIAGADDVAEIGAEFGGMTRILVQRVRQRGRGHVTSIDPSPSKPFANWVETVSTLTHVAEPSLEAIPSLPAPHAWLVDGDHNWYTVYHELELIHAGCRAHGRPLLALLHDVAWPCARRDMYYAPQRIPSAYRQPHARNAGCTLDQSRLVPAGGLRGAGFAWAEHEGGRRNGVLTAVEDFLQARLDAGEELGFARIPTMLGLGVVFDLDAPWSEALADFLVPFHEQEAIGIAERHRLEGFLEVVRLQDAAKAVRRRAA